LYQEFGMATTVRQIEADARREGGFQRCNLFAAPQQLVRAHGGRGLIEFARLADAGSLSGCNFIDFTIMPAGTSIGEHTHLSTEEEYYLVLEGEGRMIRDGEEFEVRAGDLIRNAPGGTHALTNTGAAPLKLFVFEVRV
jgi:mannose-6-phosphate isomerase-like protein (cupin superfamily)